MKACILKRSCYRCYADTFAPCLSWEFKIIWMSKVFKSHCSLIQTLQPFQEKHTPSCPPNTCRDMYSQWMNSAVVWVHGLTQIVYIQTSHSSQARRSGLCRACCLNPVVSLAPNLQSHSTSLPWTAPLMSTDRTNKIHMAIKQACKYLESCPNNILLSGIHINVFFRYNLTACSPVCIANLCDADENQVCNQVTMST